jgi:hypothetical protein
MDHPSARRWDHRRASWQAVYNAACLHALPDPSGPAAEGPSPENAEIAVRLLQLAISNPACGLERPSEWIGTDPDLQSLHSSPAFKEFVYDQAQKDFDRSLPNPNIGDSWFWKLYTSPRGASQSPQGEEGLPVCSPAAALRALRGTDRIIECYSKPHVSEKKNNPRAASYESR